MYDRQNQKGAVYYYILPSEKGVSFTKSSSSEQLYNPKRPSGIVRKAILKREQEQDNSGNNARFVDHEFKYTAPDHCRLVRLYDFYKKEVDLFPYNETDSAFIELQDFYNSFVAESGIISYGYARTLFITQTINQRGYYQYFVKRNGEYFVEECDDLIPVDKNTWKPLWGLSTDHPWQIMLFKAWLKQCQSIDNMYNAEPFAFLEAFGLPEYRLFNFRKQLKFLTEERIPESDKSSKISAFPLFDKDIILVGKTVNSKTVRNLGLVPNAAAYRVQLESGQGNKQLFKVYSSLPCHWIGTHSAVNDTPLNDIKTERLGLDLQRTFIMTEKEVLTCFNKFYGIPVIASQPKNILIQDCITLQSAGKPLFVRFNVAELGLLAMCIELPKRKIEARSNKYPQFRYFLSKKCDQEQMSRSHFREDIANSRLEQNMYLSSTCDKWNFYRIDYVQGYENHAGFFSKVEPGEYILFIQAEMNGPVKVRFDSHVRMEEPYQYEPTPDQTKEIFDSTFFSISKVSAVEATFNQATFEESIAFNNSFEELGFGSICIKTLAKAKHKIAMRVYPEKLKAAGLRLLSYYEEIQGDEDKGKNFVLVSESGKPRIVVLERLDKLSKSEIGQVFPPEGTVQFFKVMPNRVFQQPPQSYNLQRVNP